MSKVRLEQVRSIALLNALLSTCDLATAEEALCVLVEAGEAPHLIIRAHQRLSVLQTRKERQMLLARATAVRAKSRARQ